jgi:hypothetical protein
MVIILVRSRNVTVKFSAAGELLVKVSDQGDRTKRDRNAQAARWESMLNAFKLGHLADELIAALNETIRTEQRRTEERKCKRA